MMNITVRKLTRDDLECGYLEIFDPERNVDYKHANEIFEKISLSSNHLIFVAIVNNELIGTVTLIIEPKFIRNGGIIGHIEDVEIKKKFQKQGIGKFIIQKVLDYAEKNGCYKTILDCNDNVMSFYEGVGFFHQDFLGSNVMRYNHKKNN